MKENFSYCDEVTIKEEAKASALKRLANWNMEIRCIKDAWIVPYTPETADYQGEVITESGKIVPDVCSGTIYKEGWTVEFPKEAEQECEVLYLGSVNLCWGHYITDGISKMWCLENDGVKSLVARGVPVMFVAEWMQVDTMPNAWRHLVDLLGGQNIQILPLRQITKFKKLYIPTNTIQNGKNGRLYTKEFTRLITKLKNAALSHFVSTKLYEKIYFSRTKFNSSHSEFGERTLEKVFRKAGYHIVYPELLSFEQQVYLLDRAKSVAGTMGSVSHNFMFCKSGIEVTILRKAWYTNDFQYVINQIANLNVTYIDCHLSVFTTDNPNLGPFYMYLNDNVREFFKRRYNLVIKNNYSTRDYMQYVRACLRKADMKQRTESPEYYYQKMREELKNDNWKKYVYATLKELLPNKISMIIIPKLISVFK